MQAGTYNGAPVTWRSRAEPLAPVAVAACGDDARLLARRVLALGDSELGRLQGFVTGEWLVLLAEPEQLPWTPGVRYLGRDPEAPQLLLPTISEPAIAAALLQRGLAARFPRLRPPLLVLAEERTVLSAAAARTLDRERLRQWVEDGA